MAGEGRWANRTVRCVMTANVYRASRKAKKMEEQGIEPRTSRMRSERSTTELFPQLKTLLLSFVYTQYCGN